MFKEKYQSAYNRIEGDRTQIAKILAKASEPAPKKKKFVFPFRFGTAFAAVLVVCISLYSLPQFKNVTEPAENKPQVEDRNPLPDATLGVKPDVENAPVSESIPVPATANKENGKTTATPNTNSAVSEDVAPAVEPSISEDAYVVEPAIPADQSDAISPASMLQEESMVVYKSVVSGGGAGGGSSRVAENEIVKQYTVPFDESYGYASVTVYASHVQIEKAFSNQNAETISGKSVIISGDAVDKHVLVKLETGYAEIYAQNISDTQLAEVISAISIP